MAMQKVHGSHRMSIPRRRTAVQDQAQRAKRRGVPSENLRVVARERKFEEGGSEPQALVAVVTGCAGALGAGYGWFRVLGEDVVKDAGVESLSYWTFISEPSLSMDYMSIIGAAAVGAFFGAGIPLLMFSFWSNPPRQQ